LDAFGRRARKKNAVAERQIETGESRSGVADQAAEDDLAENDRPSDAEPAPHAGRVARNPPRRGAGAQRDEKDEREEAARRGQVRDRDGPRKAIQNGDPSENPLDHDEHRRSGAEPPEASSGLRRSAHRPLS